MNDSEHHDKEWPMVKPLSYDVFPPPANRVGESRYICLDDPVMLTYQCDADLQEGRSHIWDFRALEWWSRIFEYRWLKDVVNTFLAPGLAAKTAIDAGCGIKHAGCFMLAELGFGRVVAMDIKERHELLERLQLGNLEYYRTDISRSVPHQADLVCCLSVLEHIDPPRQAQTLENLCHAVAPGGLLLLTFDMPGFEWDTNLDLYKRILRDQAFEFIDVEIPPAQRLTSRNGPICHEGWAKVGRFELECYRLLAWRADDQGVRARMFRNDERHSWAESRSRRRGLAQ